MRGNAKPVHGPVDVPEVPRDNLGNYQVTGRFLTAVKHRCRPDDLRPLHPRSDRFARNLPLCVAQRASRLAMRRLPKSAAEIDRNYLAGSGLRIRVARIDAREANDHGTVELHFARRRRRLSTHWSQRRQRNRRYRERGAGRCGRRTRSDRRQSVANQQAVSKLQLFDPGRRGLAAWASYAGEPTLSWTVRAVAS
jgi:hypothetical protein